MFALGCTPEMPPAPPHDTLRDFVKAWADDKAEDMRKLAVPGTDVDALLAQEKPSKRRLRAGEMSVMALEVGSKIPGPDGQQIELGEDDISADRKYLTNSGLVYLLERVDGEWKMNVDELIVLMEGQKKMRAAREAAKSEGEGEETPAQESASSESDPGQNAESSAGVLAPGGEEGSSEGDSTDTGSDSADDGAAKEGSEEGN
ncbi:MAG TPA: hypothetical protein DDW52_08650 [Planctomycetaceae bacterium]|nr:hypothetical protein [Planctomycetaceae bacterium]